MFETHCHTDLSDGENTTEEVVTHITSKTGELAKQGYQWAVIAAITDHDIVNTEWVERVKQYIASFAWRITFEECPYISMIPWVEISACQSLGEVPTSLHITAYSNLRNTPHTPQDSLESRLEWTLSNIRRWKKEKIERQCRTLASIWMQISIDWVIDVFSFETLQRRYPTTRIDNFNNGHLRDAVYSVDTNQDVLRRLIGTEIHYDDFIRSCLRRGWEFTRIVSLKEDVENYEPELKDIASKLDLSNTVLAVPHPHLTFKTIERFSEAIDSLVLGINAIEISSTMPQEWVDVVYETRRKYKLLLTFWSDSHGVDKTDATHGKLWGINSYYMQRYGSDDLERHKSRFLHRVNGPTYRSAMSWTFS